MQTVILAAGDGTRLHPLTDATPKPLLPVGRECLLAETARTAVEAGASALYTVVPPDYRRFLDALGDSIDGVPVSYAVQPRPVGTADAVRQATRYFDGPFAVLPGDALFDRASIRELYRRAPAVGIEPDDGDRTRAVGDGGQAAGQFGARDGDATGLLTGACALPASVHDLLDVGLSDTGEREFDDVLARVGSEADLTRVEHGYYVDVDHAWDLLTATETALSAWAAETSDPPVDGEVSDRARLDGPVLVEEGASIGDGVVVEGPAVVSSGATVAPHAIVRPSTYLGPGVTIGHTAEVANSIVQRGVTVGHGAYVADSLVGADANLAPGTTVANRRHDGRTVSSRSGTDRLPTGRSAFGVVVGPRVKTGIDTSIDAGVSLSTGVTTEPDECVMTDR